MSKFFAIVVAIGFLLAAPAIAGTDNTFDSADADNDGKVTMTEATDAMPDFNVSRFNRADANDDGTLSPEEYDALRE